MFKPDIVHSHWVVPNGVIASFVQKTGLFKHIISCPGSDVTAMSSNFLFKMLGKYACNKATVLTTNSHDLHDELRNLGVSNNRFSYVLYGASVNKATIDSEYISDIKDKNSISDDEKIILAVGRLVPKKGFKYLIQAIRFIKAECSYKIIIVGDGRGRDEIIRLANLEKVSDRVVFTGKVSFQKLPQFYMMADLFVMPAIREPVDGLNVVVIEAMKYSLPIVATNVGGNELVIEDGKSGLLCNERNSRELGACISNCLQNEKLMDDLAINAHKIFISKASWPKIVGNYIDLSERSSRVFLNG